ncbi:MAG: hypothetical protein Q8M33_13255 [Hydrogenophaga sp.]|nr:hypothetical protein [Hydrogenophaga sp.]
MIGHVLRRCSDTPEKLSASDPPPKPQRHAPRGVSRWVWALLAAPLVFVMLVVGQTFRHGQPVGAGAGGYE